MTGESKDAWNGRTGGCLCGAVRYRIDGPPLFLLACHCTDCQVRSGGAFSMSLPVLESGFTLTEGKPVSMGSKHEDRTKTSLVCGGCHTRLWLVNDATPGVVIIKAGTLDRREDLDPIAHIWLCSKQPWVPIPEGVLRYETQPADYTPVLTAWAARTTAAPA